MVIPAELDELTELNHWITWAYETRGGKRTKVPYCPETGEKADSTDPKTWRPFRYAMKAVEAELYEGAGFVFSKDAGYVGVDVDGAFDEEGCPTETAMMVLRALPTYAEYSPSGNGLHLIVKGAMPGSGRRNNALGVEAYDTARFFTMTFRPYGPPRGIIEGGEAWEALHGLLFPSGPERTEKAETRGPSQPVDLSDTDLIQKMVSSASGGRIGRLLAGDTSDYNGDDSSADMALCSYLAWWCDGDTARMDRIFRSSGLMREKWDSKRGPETYGERTIGRAVAGLGPDGGYRPHVTREVALSEAWAESLPPSGEDSEPVATVALAPAIEKQLAQGETPDTWPYAVDNGGIVYLTRKEDQIAKTRVCEFTAYIKAEEQAEGGETWYEIEGRTAAGKPFSLAIAASSFADDKTLRAAIKAQAGAGGVMYTRMGGHIGPAIERLSPDAERRKRYERTGWAGGSFLIPGREPEGVHIALHSKTPYRVDPAADLAKGQEALGHLMEAADPRFAAVALSHLFQAPAARVAGWRGERYCLFLSGRTGSLKSSWSMAAMCLYGPEWADEQHLTKWGEGATSNAIMAVASYAADVPFLIDNYKPGTGGGSRAFVGLIHNILEGGDKLRLNRAAQIRETREVHAWPFSTGEDVPSNDAASLARILVVPWSWERGRPNPHLTEAQRLSPHLCAVGAAWLSWLESDEGRASVEGHAARFPELRDEWAMRLVRLRKDIANPLRVASNLASNALTWEMMGDCPAVSEALSGYIFENAEGLEIIAASMAEATAEASEGTRFMEAVHALLGSGRYVLGERHGQTDEPGKTILGWNDGDGGAYLIPLVAIKAVNDLLGSERGQLGCFSKQALYGQLEGIGAIKSKGKEETCVIIKVAGRTKRTLHVWLDKPEDLETEDL